MALNKSIDVELGFTLMADALPHLGMTLPTLGEDQPHLKIAKETTEYSQVVWENISGGLMSFDRLAVLSFRHAHNTDQQHMPELAYFSSISLLFESRQPETDVAKGFLSYNTSETEDGQAGLSRLILKDGRNRDMPYNEENVAAFREEVDRIMGRLMMFKEMGSEQQDVA